MEKYQEGLGKFSSHTRFEVSDGSIIFWHGIWYGDQVLKVLFPNLSNTAHFKDVSMTDHLVFSSDSHQWNVNFIIATHD